MIYHNFYIKAKVELLEVPLPLKAFMKLSDDGVALDPVEYMTIPEYLKTINHTVDRISSDGYFIKGFGFNLAGLDELRSKFVDFGLTLGENVFILSPGEIGEELAKPEWSQEPAAEVA